MKMSAALLLALAVGAGASASSPPADDASLVVAPTGVEQKEDVDAIIADGLDPKHATVDKDDPLLFKHRFEHHDAATNRLTYLQYEARRHAHVVILDDLNATFCTYQTDNENSTLITLDVLTTLFNSVNLTLGSILAGGAAHCSALGGEAHELIRERVVSPPRVRPSARRPDAVTVILETRGAELHECFHHSTVEYYHGDPESHGVFRAKRLNSLVSNGREVPEDRFASTDNILAAAKAKQGAVNTSRIAAKEYVLQTPAEGLDRRFPPRPELPALNITNGSAHHRKLSHVHCGWGYPPSGSVQDIGLSLRGTDCTNRQAGSGMLASDCFWRDVDSPISEIGLKAENTYELKWTSTTSQRVDITIWEYDPGSPFGSQHCGTLAMNHPNQRYQGNVANSPNSLTFTMPDLLSTGCGTFFEVGVPEFVIYIDTVFASYFFGIPTSGACHKGWTNQFRMMKYTPPSPPGGFQMDLSRSLSSSSDARLQCDNCGVGVTGNVHVLVRQEQFNPFAET